MEELTITLTVHEWLEISGLAGSALAYDAEYSEAVDKLDDILGERRYVNPT